MKRMERGRILIVDDDENVRSMVRLVLEDEGLATQLADDGEAALEALAADPDGVSLVLVDMMRPRLGGPGFLKRKAADPAIAAVPVVVVSAVPDLMTMPDTADVRAVLRKPVAIPELLDAVRAHARTVRPAFGDAEPAPPAT
jgi:DNA-binding response OmpR family regulator